jgi:hypothetical protein
VSGEADTRGIIQKTREMGWTLMDVEDKDKATRATSPNAENSSSVAFWAYQGRRLRAQYSQETADGLFQTVALHQKKFICI